MPNKPYIIASLDFGASNSRLFLREQNYGDIILPNSVYCDSQKTKRYKGPNGYICENVDGMLEKLLRNLYRLETNKRKGIKVFSISGHGSSNFICLDKEGKAIFGTPSYDQPLTKTDHDLFYKKFGSPDQLYLETGTPNQPKTLNWAKLLFHHKINYPNKWKKVKYIVPLNIYVGLRLCGSINGVASEHTQMHNHGYGEKNNGEISNVIYDMGIKDLFPPFKRPYDILGRVKPRIAEKYNLNKDCIVGVGGHDSSIFALIPKLLGFDKSIALSSGTWDVIMANRKISLESRLQNKGLLYNTAVDGGTLRTVLFRGGEMRARYLKQLKGCPNDVEFNEDVFNEIISSNNIIKPAYMDGFGPYSNTNVLKKIPYQLKKNYSKFHHTLAISLAIQRALAIKIVGELNVPKKISLNEFHKNKNEIIVVGGHLAGNYIENGKNTNKLTMSLEILRRIIIGKVYRLNFPEPTSVATHVLGVCAYENKLPNQIKKRIEFKAENVSFYGDRVRIDNYITAFENQVPQ